MMRVSTTEIIADSDGVGPYTLMLLENRTNTLNKLSLVESTTLLPPVVQHRALSDCESTV
jgi:hypothetical protein